MTWLARAEVEGVIRSALTELGVPHEETAPASFVVALTGTGGLPVPVRLAVGEESLLVEALFLRRPDEDGGELYRFLLQRNAGAHGVHFAVDRLGDVYAIGRVPLLAVTPEEVERLLGAVVNLAEETFDAPHDAGFARVINRERRWREHAPPEDLSPAAQLDLPAGQTGGRHRRRG
jgi:Putative bacterial sensory transduction regulator